MDRTFEVRLPADLERAVLELSLQEGRTPEKVVEIAVRQQVFLRRFRSLKKYLTRSTGGEPPMTDDDVFDQVS